MVKIITIARIGKDATIIGEKSTKLLKFTACVNVGYGEKATAVWFDVNTFVSEAQLERAQKFAAILTKGNKVAVVGKFSQREYEGKKYNQIETTMNDIEVVEFKNDKDKESSPDDEAVPGNDDRAKDAIPF